MKKNQLTTQEEAVVFDYLSMEPNDTFDLEAFAHSLYGQSHLQFSDIIDFILDLKYDWGVKSKYQISEYTDEESETWWNKKTHNWYTNAEIEALCERHLHPTKTQRVINFWSSSPVKLVIGTGLSIISINLIIGLVSYLLS